MGKLTYALFVLFAIQFAVIVYLGGSFPGMTVFGALTGAEQWSNLGWVDYIGATLISIGAIGIAVGLYIVRSDFIVYASIAAVLLSFGQAYYELYQIINSYGYIPAQILWFFFVPLLLPWFIIIIEFARGKD